MAFFGQPQQAYGQKRYRVTASVQTNITGDPYSYNRVLILKLAGMNVGNYDFVVGNVSNSWDLTYIPTPLSATGYSYSGATAQSTQTCSASKSYPIGLCENRLIPESLCGANFGYTITVAPIVTTTGTGIDPNRVYCPGETIDLTATTGYTSYTWQYQVPAGSWQTIRTTTGNTTTVSAADIGTNYLTNIYFRAIAESCSSSVTTSAGPYRFSSGRVSVPDNGYTPEPPRCKGGNDGKIVVNTLSRTLLSGEVFMVSLYNAQDNGVGQTLQSSTLPITLDGADRTRFPGGISPGSYTLLVESYIGGNVSTCGTIVKTPVTVGDRTAVTASAAVTSNYNGAMISCVGYTDGIITVSAAGGVGGFQYSSNGGTTYQAGAAFPALGAGSYTFTAKDANGCTASTTVVPITPPVVVGVSSAYATSAYGSGGAHVSCHPNDTGGTKNNGAITVEASGGSGTLQYSLAGGTHSTTYQAGAAIAALYPDTYTVSVRDANGCVSTDHPVVQINPPAEIVYGSVLPEDLTCNGISTGALELTNAAGGIGAFQYSVNGGGFQNSNRFENLAAGNFTVTIRDAQGCTKAAAPVTISQPTAVTFSTITTTLQSCPERVDGSISLVPATGGTGAHTYSIDGTNYISESTPVIFSNLASGNYSVYAMDSKGCQAISAQYVGIKTAITGAISVLQPISCNGQSDGSLNLTPAGGTAPYTFAWSTLATTEDVSALADGTYSVTITDSKGCPKLVEFTLNEPGVLSLNPVVSDYNGYGVTCHDATDGSVTLTVLGGTAPFTYNWSTGGAQKDVTGLAPGSYDVHVTDAHGCGTSSLQIPVSQPAALTLDLSSFKDISCFGGADGVLEGAATGGAGIYEYSVNGTVWQESEQFSGLTARAYTLRLRDDNGCVATPVAHTLTEPTKLVLTKVKQVDTSCGESNGSALVDASGGTGTYLYTWYDALDATISEFAEATTLASGDYQAVVTDGNSCRTEITVIINDSDGPKISQQLLQGLTCHDSNDGAIGIGITEGLAPYTILWDTQESALSISNVTGGAHWVEVHDVNGCRGKAVFEVPFPSALAVDYTTTAPLCTGNADGSIGVTVSGGNAGNYVLAWSTGDAGTALANLKAGTYHVTVKDSKDCVLEQDIVLLDPPLFTVDAGGDRTICVGQKLAIRAEEDDATYQWTSDAGYTSADREVVLTTPARYTLRVINHNGCVDDDSFTLATSNDLLTADFLMVTEAHAGDTVILIDVSWPVPESIAWTLPDGATALSKEDMYADVVFDAPGDYTVLLTTHLGECVSSFTKTITILEGRTSSEGRAGEDLVTRFDVYPNPNDGAFAIEIVFSEAVQGRLRMLSMSGNRLLLDERLKDATTYAFAADLQSIPSGIYFLILDVAGKTYSKRIVIK